MYKAERAAEIAAAQARYDEQLLRYPNVVGTGIGYRQRAGRPTDELCLVVMVSQKLKREELAPGTILPRALDGLPIDVIETGDFAV
ncbi:MAG: hypothetical protein OXI34_08925 [Chloroflexota bacterium]|nr:hypothetical protein [Chloroflexota bacterium]MDE2948145.1 hypothetical protein [Chloroflexota bacterium]